MKNKLFVFKLKHKSGPEAEVVSQSYSSALSLLNWKAIDTLCLGEFEVLGVILNLKENSIFIEQVAKVRNIWS